ncbi:MAG: spore coat associated protein CotJA [Clostridia bacterium]|nr:spore coat associated protein CotJA [Clostridia bacterium]
MENNNCMACAMPDKGCGCVGYAYVPIQELGCVYNVDAAISAGTVFPELSLTIDEYGKICKKWGDTADE